MFDCIAQLMALVLAELNALQIRLQYMEYFFSYDSVAEKWESHNHKPQKMLNDKLYQNTVTS